MTGSGDTSEIVWSGGDTLSADQVMKAFKLAPEKSAAVQRDALPTALNSSSTLVKIAIWAVIIIVMLLLFRCGSGGDGSGYRTGGGSYGGFSSGGGGHK
jgi:hypothetical protein